MSAKFTGFGLLTHEVQSLARFYKDVLGASIEDSDVHCVVTIGDFSFPIYNPHLHKESETLFRNFSNSSLWLEFKVGDVDAEYSRLASLNIANVVPPHNTPFGRRVIFIQDPDGNKITLYQ